MGREKVGYRRLYDSIACSLPDQEELWFSFKVGPCCVDLYVGPKPRFGLTVIKADKFIVPGEQTLIGQFEYNLDASKTSYRPPVSRPLLTWLANNNQGCALSRLRVRAT
jgi:hypothetical protein